MNKYIKLEDALKGLNIGYGKYDYVSKVAEYYYDLPAIEIPTELNGVILKDCDKVIEPFLEEHECDELWRTVRALRDFYDWATTERKPCLNTMSTK